MENYQEESMKDYHEEAFDCERSKFFRAAINQDYFVAVISLGSTLRNLEKLSDYDNFDTENAYKLRSHLVFCKGHVDKIDKNQEFMKTYLLAKIDESLQYLDSIADNIGLNMENFRNFDKINHENKQI